MKNSRILMEKQAIKILEKAGWYENRKNDISQFAKSCKENNINLFKSAKEFLEEFSDLKRGVSFYVMDDKKNILSKKSFSFLFFTNRLCIDKNFREIVYPISDKENEWAKLISRCTDEDYICVGDSGIYYQAKIFMGISGKLYCLHDYDDDVLIFNNFLEFMIYELHDMVIDLNNLHAPKW
ncbi:SUKH-3 domain-containing protein [uncultured Clostridium sp.]|uniref:SUKH-3 domain-containing protein n=1 Tax=uncultured Clostridium sp. TaxID=59620 RepID=UPI0028EE65C8|nr:SUKH-3 domain-containing protein [uncultured Clostridium sp.]